MANIMEEPTVEIPLTRGRVAIIDAADLPLVEGFTWHAQPNGTRLKPQWYAVATVRRENGRRTTVRLHRLLMNAPPGIDVDHRNSDGLDCRRNNLRLCNDSQNQANARHRKSKTGFKGVHWDSVKRRWRAQITHHGKRHRLGRFIDEADAARAYDAAAIRLFGEFARLNFPHGSAVTDDVPALKV